jgi:hypothetical protein
MSARTWTLQDRLNYYASLDRVHDKPRAVAVKYDDLRTPAQMHLLFKLDAECCCERLLGCLPEELSKGAASVLIEYLKGGGR